MRPHLSLLLEDGKETHLAIPFPPHAYMDDAAPIHDPMETLMLIKSLKVWSTRMNPHTNKLASGYDGKGERVIDTTFY